MAEMNNRIIYDTTTGRVVHQTGEAIGDVLPHSEWGALAYIDVPYGSVDYTKNFIKAVDLETLSPVIESFPVPEPSKEQLKINQLEEDILLLQTDAIEGGIL